VSDKTNLLPTQKNPGCFHTFTTAYKLMTSLINRELNRFVFMFFLLNNTSLRPPILHKAILKIDIELLNEKGIYRFSETDTTHYGPNNCIILFCNNS